MEYKYNELIWLRAKTRRGDEHMTRFYLEKQKNVEAPLEIPLVRWWHYALAAAAIAAVILL